MRESILRSSLGSLLVQGWGTLLNFMNGALLARILGIEGYGVYAFALALLMLLAVPAQLGLPQLVVRETSAALALNKPSLVRGLWFWSAKAGVIAAGAITVTLAIFLVVLFEGSARFDALFAGLLLIPALTCVTILGAMLRGLGHSVIGLTPHVLMRPLLIFVLLLLVLVGQKTSSPVVAMYVTVAGTVLSCIFGFYLLWRLRPADAKAVPEVETMIGYWLKALLPFTAISSLYIVIAQVDVLIVGLFRSNEEVGMYRAASQLAGLVIFGLAAVNQALHPQIARLYAQNDMNALQTMITQSTRIIFLLAIIPFVIFALWGGKILSLVFGAAFAPAAVLLLILSIGHIANAFFGSVGALLNMTGHERSTLTGLSIAIVLNLVLNFALVPYFGGLGAAIATCLSYITWNIALWWAVRQKLQLETTIFGSWTAP